jgi:hypothetical protein
VNRNIFLSSNDIHSLKKAIDTRIYFRKNYLGLSDSKKLYLNFYKDFKNKLGISVLGDLRKDDLDLALNFIQVWKEPRNLKR